MAITLNNDLLVLQLYIQPKASRDEIVGLHGDKLKVAIAAPPVDSQANIQLIKFLAKQFKVAKNNVNIKQGNSSRHKRVEIKKPQQIPKNISALIEQQNN